MSYAIRISIIGVVLFAFGIVVGVGFGLAWSDSHPPAAPAVVAPMPNAWQILVVRPGAGNPSHVVAYGASIDDALHNAAENGTSYDYFSRWVAGSTCTGVGVRTICNAVRP